VDKISPFIIYLLAGQDSVVTIKTRYKLDDQEIGSRGWWGEGEDFPHQSRLALGSTQPSIQRVPDLFFWSKAAG